MGLKNQIERDARDGKPSKGWRLKSSGRLNSIVLKVSLGLLLTCSLAVATEENRVNFSLEDLQGEMRSLSDYRGKWVVVNYWATWCPPCLEEMPELELFHNSHSNSAVVLGVNMETIDRRLLEAFVNEQFLSYPILIDSPRPQTELGTIPGLPTTYLVSPDGRVVGRQLGTVTREMLENFIARYDSADEKGAD